MTEKKTDAAQRIAEAKARDEEAATSEDPNAEEPTVADVPEPDQDPTPEPELEPQAVAQISEAKIARAVDTAWTTAGKQAKKILALTGGSEDELATCPNCDLPGYVNTARPPLEPERAMMVDASMGRYDRTSLEQWAGIEECGICKGHGKLLRPTKVENQREGVCYGCNGMGWVQPLAPNQPVTMQQGWKNIAPSPQFQNGPPPAEWTPPPPPLVPGPTG